MHYLHSYNLLFLSRIVREILAFMRRLQFYLVRRNGSKSRGLQDSRVVEKMFTLDHLTP
jgi:hypothetical protein